MDAHSPNDNRRPKLLWAKQKMRRRGLPYKLEYTPAHFFDVDIGALDAERQKKAAVLKKITFSKKLKEEEREEEDVLRVGMGDMEADIIGDRERGCRESGGGSGGEQASMLEQVPPQREHSPWTCDGQDNIPGLSPTSKSARMHGSYDLPQVNAVETRAVPIPPQSLFPEPPDSVSDISDKDLYSPKEVGVDTTKDVALQVQVQEEQREDEDVFFDSPIPSSFPDLQTSTSAPIPNITIQNATSELSMSAHVDKSASYLLDTGRTVHPKNKRKQHSLLRVKNARSPKKVKTDVCVSNVGKSESESNREVVCVQDKDGSKGEVPCASMPALKKRAPKMKRNLWKEKERDVVNVIDQVETHAVTFG